MVSIIKRAMALAHTTELGDPAVGSLGGVGGMSYSLLRMLNLTEDESSRKNGGSAEDAEIPQLGHYP